MTTNDAVIWPTGHYFALAADIHNQLSCAIITMPLRDMSRAATLHIFRLDCLK